jgi:hypothetical protein
MRMREQPTVVGFDVRPGGNGGLPGYPGVDPQADVAFVLGPQDHAELLQAAWWEPTRVLYGLALGMLDVDPAAMKQGSGAWVQPTQMLGKPYTVPTTGAEQPAETHELGTLPLGTTDPSSSKFDERTLVAEKGKVVELRVPWAMLGFSDPSSLTLYHVEPDGSVGTSHAGKIGIAVQTEDAALLQTKGYAWEAWQTIAWHERRKAGFDVLADAMTKLSAPGAG